MNDLEKKFQLSVSEVDALICKNLQTILNNLSDAMEISTEYNYDLNGNKQFIELCEMLADVIPYKENPNAWAYSRRCY